MNKRIVNIIVTQKKEMRRFLSIQKQLHILQQIIYHLNNLTSTHTKECRWSQKENETLQSVIISMISIFRNNCYEIDYKHYQLVDELDQ